MIAVSNAFKKALDNDDRRYLFSISIELQSGYVLSVDNSNIIQNSVNFNEGVTASGEFTIGSCIINKFSFTLNNIYGKFDGHDFSDALVSVNLGLDLENGTEWIKKGRYIVDTPTYNGSYINLECLDYMTQLDKNYSDVPTSYPATLGVIVRDICSACNVVLQTTTFDNDDYVVEERPDDDALTCRQVLAYCAQIACKYAKFNTDGYLELGWFDIATFEDMSGLDGGIFDSGNPYKTGDNADGGRFNPWDTGYSYDSGTFSDGQEYNTFYALSSLNASTDDVVITGIRVTGYSKDRDEEASSGFLYGNSGYVLSIEDNKFIPISKEESVATFIGQKLVGLQFRPLSISCLSDPTTEPGDIALVIDRNNNSYKCFVTNLTFNAGNYMSIACDAESPLQNTSKRYSEMTKTLVEARKNAQAQISNYDLVATNMTQLISQGFGLYTTKVKQDDGSYISYMHDKPTIQESEYVWMKTSTGLMVSKDGGVTWAIDANGNALFNVITAHGINADWINTGELTVGGSGYIGAIRILDENGNQIGKWDKNGINASKGTFSGQLAGATGTFSGNLQAAGGTFAGNLSAAGGTFKGNLQAAGGTFSGELSAAGGTFKGALQAATGSFSGQITATSGKIAGYQINGTDLYYQRINSSDQSVGMSASPNKYAFWSGETNNAGGTSSSNAKYRVGHNGALWADEAHISGTINATSGTFNGTVNASSGTFNGTVNASAGNFNSITVSGSTWSGGSVNSASVSSPSISGGSYSSGTVRGCTVPSNSALYMGNSSNYFEYSNGAVIIRAQSGGVTLAGGASSNVAASVNGVLNVSGKVIATGLSVSGEKNRVISTSDYGVRALHSYETPLPTFSDYGKGKISEDGFCYIETDPIFMETINTDYEPTVFLTKYGEGDIWVDNDRSTAHCIIVSGTPFLKFSWEIRYMQSGVSNERIPVVRDGFGAIDYGFEGQEYYIQYERSLIEQ